MKQFVIYKFFSSVVSQQNLCITMSEARAAEIVKLLYQLNEFNKDFNKRIETEFEVVYKQLHSQELPRPVRPIPSDEFRNTQTILAHGKLTDEDRQLLKKKCRSLQLIHMKAVEEYNQWDRNWVRDSLNRAEEMKSARELWIEQNYVVPSDLLCVASFLNMEEDDNEFEYDEVEIM